MEHAKELIYQAVAVIIFCIGVSLLVRQYFSYESLISSVKMRYQTEDALNISDKNDMLDETSYSELITSLMHPLEYDLEIDGLLISKQEHTVDQIENYHIADTTYMKSYCYDSNGVVTRIVYTSFVGG